MKQFPVNISLTDFSPLFFDFAYLFKRLKATGIDGVEIVIGFKSRWNAKHIRNLSQKYELPVISLYQPMWSGAGLWFDERFVDVAHILGVKRITCHPLPCLSFSHPRMQRYLGRLSQLQKENGVEIFLENLEKGWLGFNADTYDIEKLLETVENFNLKITLDIDHLKLGAPHKEPWFPKVLPYLGNIHLSSFTKKIMHMPLYLGDLQAKAFIQALYRADYQGLLTLEIQYPGLVTWGYDFDMIKKSVALVKSVP